MSVEEIGTLKEMTAIAVTKDPEQERNINFLLSDKVGDLLILNPSKLTKLSLKKKNPNVVIFADEDLKLIKFLKKVFPKSYIVHSTDNPSAEFLKKSVECGTSHFIEKNITSSSLYSSLNTPVEVFKLDKKVISTSKNFQKISNSLSGMIAITDGDKVYWGNKPLIEFFKITNLNEFNQKINGVSNLFVPKKNFLSFEEGEKWLETIEKLPSDRHTVLMYDTEGKPKYFIIGVSDFSIKPFRKILTFFEIPKKILEKSLKKDAELYSWDNVINHLKVEINRFERYKVPCSSIYIDVKQRFGKGGSIEDKEIISFIHGEILEMLRPTDYCGQMGTSQFVLIASHTDEINSEKMCKRLVDNLLKIKEYPMKKYQFNFAITASRNKDVPLKIVKRLNTAIKSTQSRNGYEIVKA